MKHYAYLSFFIICLLASSSIPINCIVDLQGQTVTLPKNTNFDFAGGDIINGKLIFSGGYIDYRIMNATLQLEGEVRLKDPEFEFIADRWDIVESEVDEQFAISNKRILKDLLSQVKAMQGTTFKIDDLDAYFDEGSLDRPIGYTDAGDAIVILGDFELIMTNDTHIRAQPNFRRL